MAEPAKLRIDLGNYVECPQMDQLVTVETCENCKHAGAIGENSVECYYEADKP